MGRKSGLLISLPEESARDLSDDLRAHGVPCAAVIGRAGAAGDTGWISAAERSLPEGPLADSRKIATVSKNHASGDTGADSGGGEGEGMGDGRGASEGSGGPGPGNSSSGAGLSGEFDAAFVDKVPQILKKIDPAYPERARSLGICGRVVVRFLVEPDGRVSKPSIVEAHPKGFFEQSTLEALRHWQFRPGCLKGKDVATWVILPVQFRLTGQD